MPYRPAPSLFFESGPTPDLASPHPHPLRAAALSLPAFFASLREEKSLDPFWSPIETASLASLLSRSYGAEFLGG